MEDAEELRPAKRKVIHPEVSMLCLSYLSHRFACFCILIIGCCLIDFLALYCSSQHKPMSEITTGINHGIYHQGKLRVNRFNPLEAYVATSIGEIIIYGRMNMNRAFDGDIVAVELLPREQWQEEKSISIGDEGMFLLFALQPSQK